ncbi:VOC family protein [Microbacterium abyssi]|uniref:VOC family protein n=1 Tax=Microbacterium abyssi TaxID=2782166 RepID=UPI00188771FC|nr:VOC family protein [Microbacterium sp. A18JL241]
MSTIHHIGITVSDLASATTFYRTLSGGEAIGPLIKSGPAVEAATGYPGVEISMTFVRASNDVFIELLEYRGADAPRIDPNNGHIGAAHPAIVVDDIEAAIAQATDLGYPPLSATMVAGTGPLKGYRYVYILGPDEVRVELLQAPHSSSS